MLDCSYSRHPRRLGQGIEDKLSILARFEQTCRGQDAQVLRQGRYRHIQNVCQIAYATLVLPQRVDNGLPGRMPKRFVSAGYRFENGRIGQESPECTNLLLVKTDNPANGQPGT